MALALATQAQAQTTDSAATSHSVNNTQVLVGGGGSSQIDYSGSYTVRNVPDAIAPMLPGGTNPCVVAASAAGSIVGFGMSAGHSWNSEECERRNLSVLLMNASAQFDQPHLAHAAIEVLCQHDDVAMALEAVGRPCLTRQAPQQVSRTGAQTASAGTSDFDWINDPQIGR